MHKFKNEIIAAIIFLPSLISLAIGEEYWPFTSFPMYSKPYQRFEWPSVLVRDGSESEWQPMIEEDCYGRLGYVRFHFSALRFGSGHADTSRPQALLDLTQSLAQEIRHICPDRGWRTMKVILLRHDVRDHSKASPVFVRDLTSEVSIAP